MPFPSADRSARAALGALLALCVTAGLPALEHRYSVVKLEEDIVGGRLIHSLSTWATSLNASGDLVVAANRGEKRSILAGERILWGTGDVVAGLRLIGVDHPAWNEVGGGVYVGRFREAPGDPPRSAIFAGPALRLGPEPVIAGDRLLDYLDVDIANGSPALAFIATFADDQTALRGTGVFTQTARIARAGDEVSGHVLQTLTGVSIDTAGEVLYSAGIEPGEPLAQAIFDETGRLIGPGDVIDGRTLIGAMRPSTNDAGDLLFVGFFQGPAGPSSGIFSLEGAVIVAGERVDGLRVEQLLSVDLRNDGDFSFGATFEGGREGIVAPVRTMGLSTANPISVVLTREHPTELIKLPVEGDRPARITVTDPAGANVNELYYREGRPPSPLESDQFDLPATGQDPTLLVPVKRQGSGFVRVFARELGVAPRPLSVRFELIDFILTGVSMPRSAPAILDVAIRGGGFVPALELALQGPGGAAPFPAELSTLVSRDRFEARFDLRSARPGLYDLIARLPGGDPEALAGAIEIVAAPERSVLEVELRGMEVARYDTLGRFEILYTNTGDYPLPAPLFLIEGPAGTRFSLERRFGLGAEDLLALGIDPGGIPGVLPPGTSARLPVYFRTLDCPGSGPPEDPECEQFPESVCPCEVFPSETCTSCDIEFTVSLLTPGAKDYIDWPRLPPPPGFDPAQWEEAWPGLSLLFGPTWASFAKKYTELATRLSRRGIYAANAFHVYRFAAQIALGRPSSAVLGRVVREGGGAAVKGVEVVALDREGVAVSSAITDSRGAFALSWLAAGETYRLALVDRTVTGGTLGEDASLVIPPKGDLSGVVIESVFEENDVAPGCAHCDVEGLPTEAWIPPGRLFTLRGSHPVKVATSWDPNDKDGPVGEGEDKLLPPGEEITYTIYFENLPPCEDEEVEAGEGGGAGDEEVIVETCVDLEPGGIVLPVRYVRLVDVLEDSFDLSTIELASLRIGGSDEQFWSIDLEDGDLFSGYASDEGVPLINGSPRTVDITVVDPDDPFNIVGYEVTVQARLDEETRTLVIELESPYDPRNPTEGFLPPNDDLKQGEGEVAFRIRLLDGLPDPTIIGCEANIFFDSNPEPTPTPRWINTVTSTLLPEEPENPLPLDAANEIGEDALLQWTCRYAGSYEVSLWRKREGEADLLVEEDEVDSASFAPTAGLEAGVEYTWRVIAHNQNGPTEGPIWSFRVSEPGSCAGEIDGPAPADGAGVFTPEPDFAWSPSEGALAYALFLWPEGEEVPVEPVATGFTEPELAGVVRLEAPGTYLWQVIPFDAESCAVEGPVWSFTYLEGEGPPYRRMDVDASGSIDITDAIVSMEYQFLGTFRPPCLAAAEVNGDGVIDVSDIVTTLEYQFLGTFLPPEPFVDCAPFAAQGDTIDCESFGACEE